MSILEKLKKKWNSIHYPFLIHNNKELFFSDISKQETIDISEIQNGDVVAVIGDFNPQSILILLKLIDKNVILVHTIDTKLQHKYFFESALVDFVVEDNTIKKIKHNRKHELITKLKRKTRWFGSFSTGTTGRPKAISWFDTIYEKIWDSRPTLKTINFLLFDHIGGLNTLLHTLFNKGTIVAPKTRNVQDILNVCKKYNVELLPTTPTFLRMMLFSESIPKDIPKSLKIITYGTERMDQSTLEHLCKLLPHVDFRQTFGMSELGIVRVKSQSRNSLFMKIGGEGVETRVKDNVLEIRSQTRMLGYLNSDNPFYDNGWFNTGDIVEEKNDYIKVIGRTNEVINVGGLKFMASEVEKVALQFEGVEVAKAEGNFNPITGQHVELTIQSSPNIDFDKAKLGAFLKMLLPSHMLPKRLKVSTSFVSHRFKRI